jgi:hypothetical protein
MKNSEEMYQRTPLRVPGVVSGTYWLEGGALVTVRRSPADGEHTSELLSSPQPSLTLPERAVETAFIMGATKIQVKDETSDVLYMCDIEYFFRHSTLVKQGPERLRRLPLVQWKRDGEESSHFQQTQLAAGGAA